MKPGKAEFYRDAAHQWRWRIRASNGRIIADSGEGYRRRSSAIAGVACLRAVLRHDLDMTESQE